MLFIFLAGIAGCQNRLEVEPILSTAGPVTLFQQFVLDEVNLVRTNPAGYAELRLKADRIDSTDNGSYSFVHQLTPLEPLKLNTLLNLSATNYAINFVRVLIIDQGIKDLGHRNTILNSKYKSMGVGFCRNSASAFINYTVQDFGNI
jgi:hypothetical protein